MKKVWSFLKSMKFGILLLTVIGVFCLIGSFITQGEAPETYVQTYGEFWGNLIVKTQLDHVFSTWYFVALFALLCLNLILCSILRFRGISRMREALLKRAEAKTETIPGSVNWLKGQHARKVRENLYLKNGLGFWGSFVTHLGLLLLLVMAALVFKTQSAVDYSIQVGHTDLLPDGTFITVNSFDMKNIQGETDYISNVTLKFQDGTAQTADISVNHPYRWGNYTIYQESYNMNMLDIQIYTDDYPEPETITLSGETNLSLDDDTGVTIISIYGDYNITEDGKIEAFNYMDGSIKNPAYLVDQTEEGQTTRGIVLPGTVLHVGKLYVEFPQYYPIFSVKYLPSVLMPLMYLSFVLLIVGLYFCFFRVPSAYCLDGSKMTVACFKDEAELTKEIEKETSKCC